MKRTLPLFLALIFSVSVYADSSTNPNTRPAGFIENNGQVKDQSNSPNCFVKYLWAAAPGVNIQLRQNGISFDTYHQIEAGGTAFSFHRMDLNILGMNPSARLVPEHELEGVTNYYTSGQKERISDLKTFKKIAYKDVYKGIDFDVDTSQNGLLKYNFVVKDPTEIHKIKLEYAGFDQFEFKEWKIGFHPFGKNDNRRNSGELDDGNRTIGRSGI